MGRIIKGAVFLFLLLIVGCVTAGTKYTWKIEPFSQNIENDIFSATLSPADSYTAFNLIIKNKTSSDIEIDWNKTLYIENGQTNGGFMFEGVVYKDRNNPKQSDVIFAGAEFRKTIWPNNLVSFYQSWHHNEMPPGQNGIYLRSCHKITYTHYRFEGHIV